MAKIKKAQMGYRVRGEGRSCGIERQARKDEREYDRENRKANRQADKETKRDERVSARDAKKEEKSVPKQRSGGIIKPKASNVSKKLGSAKNSIGNIRFAKKKK